MLKKLLMMLIVFTTFNSFSQVTTSSINGLVVDEKGEGLPGATVTAVHTPSGTKYGTTTRIDGRYSLLNARVGGPYKIEVSFVGFNASKVEGVMLQLGQKFTQNFDLKATSTSLNEVVVKASDIISGTRTGAATNISNERLRALPTITRSISDFTRLNPTAAEGGSFAGRNDQFNNYSLDGAIFNNPFGLDASTPGGQTDANPVSIDAIEQISVQIAPYDVTQAGFTGASINAVTKSGTNNFAGTVYGFTRNQNLVGRKIKDVTFEKLDLSQNQFGFSIGGPIVKDKLFFFLNAESDTRTDIGSPFLPAAAGRSGSNISRVQASDMALVSSLLKSTFGYETGAYENFSFDTKSKKAIAKLDWNISNNHKLSFTYTFLDAFKDKPANPSAIGRRGPDFLTLQFQNSGYRINNVINGGTVELKSQFGNRSANKLQVGLTKFNDTRDPFSTPFPVFNISKDGVRYIVAGHEPFSINNSLQQQVIQATDNFNLYLGKHTLTLGAAIEKFDFDNSFNLTGYGPRVFFGPGVPMNEVASFIKSADFAKEVADAKTAFTTNNAKNTWALAETNLGQASLYAQDEWSVSNKLNISLGLRADKPLYFDTKTKIEENILRNGAYDKDVTYYNEQGVATKFDHTVLPKQTPLISPRLGFNYDVEGDKTQQLRGGTGLFTGRFPFVLIGNQVANPNFYFYCVTDPNFKFPQVWRTNLGYDLKMKSGWIATADVIYTKDINAIMVRNYGLKLPTGKLKGADTRPIYLNADRADKFGPTNAYVVSNSSLGSSFNTSVQLEKSFEDGMYLKFGYNFLDAKDVASIDAEISSDAYDRNPANIKHTNTPELAPSLYGNRHRLMVVGSKKISYGKFATTFSLFGETAQGSRYSYTYGGDINNDGSGLNDLIFIPTDAQIDGMKFSGNNAAAQKSTLKQFIANDKYLNANRGSYAVKYATLAPWYSNVDFRVLQDFKIKNRNSIQLSMDVLNIGNLFNKNWGVRQWAGETGLAQPIAVNVVNGEPTYSVDVNQKSAIQNRFDISSRWRMQFGLRYIF